MNFAYRYIQYNLKWIILFFFKKVNFKGSHHIPKNSAVIYAVNHQNTVVDALLVGIHLKKELNFLVKADAFKGTFTNLILRLLKLIPIYRASDNMGNISEKNKAVFSNCAHLLAKHQDILIFPEGRSIAIHQITPIKKGLSRIIEETINLYPDIDLKIIPVSINYENHFIPNHKVWVEFLKPININNQNYNSKNFNEQLQELFIKNVIQIEPKYPIIKNFFRHLISTFPKTFNNTIGNLKNSYFDDLPKVKRSHWIHWLFFPINWCIKKIIYKVNDPDYQLSILLLSSMITFSILLILNILLLFFNSSWHIVTIIYLLLFPYWNKKLNQFNW
jgi:1-acyl-sn-glycerol-3-phosphate acyltransferase